MTLPEPIGPQRVDKSPVGYAEWLVEVKVRVRAARYRANRAANAEVIRLYWSIGRDIVDRQERLGWGAKVIDRLSADLRREFVGQQGWSPTNLKYMRVMANAWPDLSAIGPHVVDQLPWGHVRVLLDKLSARSDRDWYASEAIANGWSRDVLAFQIMSDLRSRLGSAPSNFDATLAGPDSDQAQQMTKDPYRFELQGLTSLATERELEDALMDRVQATLLELGRGIAFVGRQVRFTVDGQDHWVDLLMFHTEQLRYIVIELKVGDFSPSQLGQLGTYVVMVDDLLRKPEIHAPTIGLLLCSGKRESIVRYSLASTAAPVAVADWQRLPDDVRAALPNAEELEAVIHDEMAQRAVEASEGPTVSWP
ncbi:MAG: PDDEXK nuclease domain-containing protein [Propionibacteriaceae bacterium]|jgi:predicted nuclease of restriction endonuclease-like (RecB) superfamily|nr:PDDEXK nuclease domain-containing protein [Propionibacteriaceae bacterium]